MNRRPAVAGAFYEGRAEALRADVERYLDRSAATEDAPGCLCPHAGYVYSGAVTGAVLSSVNIPKTVIVVSFSHRGLGARYAVWPEGAWTTPLGDVPVNAALSAKLIDASPLLQADTEAFLFEHSGEVMLPFLQVLRGDVEIVMISVYPIAPLADVQAIGTDMAGVLRDVSPRPLLVASSDMTHHESAASAEKQDRLAIDRMLALDEEGLYETVRRHDISMCGVCPAVTVIACVKGLGATGGKLVRYETSAEATGDTSDVVAYAGLVFK
jgi:AmmeMemoRadiSam system protein B